MPLSRSQFMNTAAYAYNSLPPPPPKKHDPSRKRTVISGIDFPDTPKARRRFKKLVKKANAEMDMKETK